MTAANTMDVFREAIGKRIVGLYTEPRPIAGQATVLVFDDGTGLAFAANGSHWTVTATDVARHVAIRREQLQNLERELRDVMATEAAL